MNVRLLRRIAKVIQEKPKEFDMRNFSGLTECGTTHCIGGWAAKLTGRPMHDALEITIRQGYRLFYIDNGELGSWPMRFRGRKRKGMTPNDYQWLPTPKQAAARIEHFIKTNGAE